MELSLEEAARRLGLTPEAVRKRAARGSLASRRDGRRLLIILPDQDAPPDARPDDDRPPTGHHRSPADGLTEALRAEVSYLRGELTRAHERLDEERRRHDTIVAQLVSRLPELAAPASTRAGTLAEAAPPVMAEVPAVPAPARRPWWRFW